MQCPDCGQFMQLIAASEMGLDTHICAFYFVCNNHMNCWRSNHMLDGGMIAAPEYDFLYWGYDIPQEELDGDSTLKADWEKLLHAYKRRPCQRRKYPGFWTYSDKKQIEVLLEENNP